MRLLLFVAANLKVFFVLKKIKLDTYIKLLQE